MATSLTQRGPNASAPARLPSLQTSRVADPNVRQALDALREWVEVRLGSRGDVFERAVTRREFDPQVDAILNRLKAVDEILQSLGGTTSSSSGTAASSLAAVRNELRAATRDYQAKDDAIRTSLSALGAALDSGLEALRVAMQAAAAGLQGDIDRLRALVGVDGSVTPPAAGASLSTVNVWTKNQTVEEVTLTDAATVTIDATLSNNFELTLGGNRTIANPTGLTKGMVINLVLRQDAIGSRIPTWGAMWDFGLAGTPVLSTGANKVDFVSAYYNGTAAKLLAVFRKSA